VKIRPPIVNKDLECHEIDLINDEAVLMISYMDSLSKIEKDNIIEKIK